MHPLSAPVYCTITPKSAEFFKLCHQFVHMVTLVLNLNGELIEVFDIVVVGSRMVQKRIDKRRLRTGTLLFEQS